MLNKFYEHISENKQNLFENIVLDRTRYVTIALENIFQPHNAAAVLRSCDCFGIQDVHIIENENKYQPNKDIDMGSSKWLNINKYNQLENNTVATINHLKSRGYKIVATTPHENDCLIDELPLDQPVALLFGTELTGLSDIAIEHSDAAVKLPMYGFTESYNISVSVALALYALTDRIRKEKVNWQLSQDEQTAIKLQWAKKVVKHGDKVERIINESYANDFPTE
ncbi:RNA methyltransferase [Paracrocinitomix mangrovi]|uniref:TrmH family RNA methyltransferase n=1 Tax=Paracrocinitomix mangrovi TaxID=2862509 RepID=UPI001EDB88B4|nr:RNA methyltransferase [Paracrocinitomix mangrovi]UKN02641.1 RNA methyltransferase [Paracrocinitomix mangrovi]